MLIWLIGLKRITTSKVTDNINNQAADRSIICVIRSQGENVLGSVNFIQHLVGTQVVGKIACTGSAAGVLSDENTNKLTELRDSTMSSKADFLIGIYSCLEVKRK